MDKERDNLFLDELYTPPHIDLSNEQKEEIRKTLIVLGIEEYRPWSKEYERKNANIIKNDSNQEIVLDRPVKRDPLTLLPVYPDDPMFDSLPEIKYNQK